MTGPHPAVARVRLAVRAALGDLPPGSLVLVAVSGGADSMALAAAAAFESRSAGLRCAAVVVDHQLQSGSHAVAEEAAKALVGLGVDPVRVRAVDVGGEGGPEAAARAARYAAIDATAVELGAVAVLLGHTRDDQAESVLLGLARGSGARSLSGMAHARGLYRRPLLDVERATTCAACAAEAIAVWDDPHNEDDAFARVRLRHRVLPVIEAELGPGVSRALARTAALLREDDAALEQWADEVRVAASAPDGRGNHALDVEVLAAAPAAVRRRVLRAEALWAGVPGGDLRASHLTGVDALVMRWKGQGPAHLPGGIRATRDCGRLQLAPHETVESQ
ncbi:MAG: tRNA lysidine(34) synthetase TilS [Actinomycetia bacterium]|nr:tRNA lysidine(34) synthetase TilS [Actinomycetes bacterium]